MLWCESQEGMRMFPVDLSIWLNHFEYHGRHPRTLPSALPDALSAIERDVIARSIAVFQLGERSEGRALLRAAERFAALHAADGLARIVELLILEEQRHAALLHDFMASHQIALKHCDWTDGIFRRLRRLAGLELYFHVLISAELVGIVYYRALEAATGCQRLRVLCRMLVADELAHVGFESQLLIALRLRRTPLLRAAVRSAHRLFVAGTALVVWLTHRSVLKRAGYRLRSFVRVSLAQHDFYLEPAKTQLAALETR
jgi:hypothetical protein